VEQSLGIDYGTARYRNCPSAPRCGSSRRASRRITIREALAQYARLSAEMRSGDHSCRFCPLTLREHKGAPRQIQGSPVAKNSAGVDVFFGMEIFIVKRATKRCLKRGSARPRAKERIDLNAAAIILQ